MKNVKILCLLLAMLMVVPVFAGCTKKATATVSLEFRVPNGEVDEDGNEKYDVKFTQNDLLVEGTTDDMPNVLMAVQQAFKKFEVPYELSADQSSLASAFGYKQADSTDAEAGYYEYWECTINGELSDQGRQSVTAIYQDDKIVFTWTKGSHKRQDTTAAVTTDPNAETTAEIPKDETTAVETTKEVA